MRTNKKHREHQHHQQAENIKLEIENMKREMALAMQESKDKHAGAL